MLRVAVAAAAAADVKGDLEACCSWLPPPQLQLFVVLPLQDFSAVAERTGTYTAMDYADIMEHLNERWKIGERNDLTGEVSAAGGVALQQHQHTCTCGSGDGCSGGGCSGNPLLVV